MARVGIADRPFSRGLYPATERVMEPDAYRGGGHLALVIRRMIFLLIYFFYCVIIIVSKIYIAGVKLMIIYNAKIYTMNDSDEIIENGFVEYENGKIVRVSEGRPDVINDEMMNADGMSLYPGFIDAHTHLGLFTGGVGIEGEDFNEDSDPVTPQLNVIDGINPMDSAFKDARKAGITAVAVSPGSSNAVCGSIIALKTVGKRIDNMSLGKVGMKISLGENPKMTYMDKDAAPVTRMAIASLIREALKKAEKYMTDKENDDEPPEYDAKCEALIPLLKREVRAHFHCHRADDIFTAIRIAKEFDLDYILIHCTEGHLISDELKKESASAVIGPIICDKSKPELANLTPKNCGLLNLAGVEVSICTDHSEVPIQYLPISAGIAVKNGLDFYEALKAVTKIPAKQLGLSDRIGSVQAGKDADFAMFNSNPFEVMSSPIKVIINGDEV